ncbi:conserved hypothetical protein [Flavobacterium sp. 9AF]|uniref:hypothetical protein n=1 Tax=Flavobacterium sp. 9AF TaxID=2653142 RepID=UPI0012F20F9D|nr:hypothetical protein [Flavobacterium sp. 9AF]VXC32968.1 conserved hypothetical protein [Flavobacterium sp. 9AF]
MIPKSNIYKYLAFTFIFSSVFGIIVYSFLSNRHQAIIKTKLLYTFGIVDNQWEMGKENQKYKMVSPTFLIDAIYKSMEGPKSSRYVQLSDNEDLLWITGFEVKARDAVTNEPVSKDFICHMNVDLNDNNYYSYWHLEDRIGKQYPRLTSLSNGFEKYDYPEGFGIPIKGNEYLFITSQALNHNFPSIFKKIKHEVIINHEKYNGSQKPLLSKTVFIQLPYNKNNPFETPLDPGSNQCIPVETRNHSYMDKDGNMLSGHWVVPKGKNTYHSSINEQLDLTDSLRLHFSAIHVHPFATSIALYDRTAQKNVFKSPISNYKSKTGLIEVTPFSSKEGVWLYKNHDYELVLEVNNTSSTQQDMMGSMFLFFYDKELDEKLENGFIK